MTSMSNSERKCESSEEDDDCDLIENSPGISKRGYLWFLAHDDVYKTIVEEWTKLHKDTDSSWKKLQELANKHRIKLPPRHEMTSPGICGLFFAVHSQYKILSVSSKEIEYLSFHSLDCSKDLLRKVKNSQIFARNPLRRKLSPMLHKLFTLGLSTQDPKGQFHAVPFLRAFIPIVDNIIDKRLQLEDEWKMRNHLDSYMDGTGEQTFEKCHVVSFMSFKQTVEFRILMSLAREQCIYKEFVEIAGEKNVRVVAMGVVRLDAGAPRGAIHGDDLPPSPFEPSMF